MTITWSSVAGNVDGYRVWAYVTDKTQEDETFNDPTTLTYEFRGKEKVYEIDIYSYVVIGGTEYWSAPIEGELEIGEKNSHWLSNGSLVK